MVSPSSIRMMSPGTTSAAGTLRRSPPRMTDASRRRHRAKCRDGGLGARLLHIAHRRVQEDDGKDGDGFVRQGRVTLHDPERGGDRGGDEQQDDEHILKLRQESPPRRDRFLRGKLVGPYCASRARASSSLSPLCALVPSLAIRSPACSRYAILDVCRFARNGRHVVCSLISIFDGRHALPVAILLQTITAAEERGRCGLVMRLL